MYTIDIEDDNGCTATTSVTVPKCETANNDTCRKFSFSLENRRLYLTVDEDTTGELHYAYKSLLNSMEGGNITYVFNNSKKSENYIDLSNKDSKGLDVELAKSATDSWEHNSGLEGMIDLTNYYEHYKYWDVVFGATFDLSQGNLFTEFNATDEDPTILWAGNCRGIPMAYRARLVDNNSGTICNGSENYILYICRGPLPLDGSLCLGRPTLRTLSAF